MNEAIEALTSFAFLALVFVPLELSWSTRTQPVLRRALFTDCLFYAGQYLLFAPLIILWLMACVRGVEGLSLGSLHAAISGYPAWLRILVAVGLGDLCVYWGHRLQHRVPFLWRFHRVHHTAQELDWLAAHREHPFDGLYTRTLQNAPALLLGFNYAEVAGLVVFRGMWGLFIHSNVRLPIGPLQYLVGSPALHHWHHDRERGGDCNFANLCPLLDVLFGTYRAPPEAPGAFGVHESINLSYPGLLLEPLGLWPRAHVEPEAAAGANPRTFDGRVHERSGG